MNNDNKNTSIGPLIAGVAGAAVGALTVTLLDKNKRKKTVEVAKKIGENISDLKKEAENKVIDSGEKLKQKIEKSKNEKL